MDILSSLALGFSVSLEPANLAYCFIGVLLGTVIGVLPGLGSAATIALLLPITYRIPPTSAVIMLAGIWYGSMYGGSTTSILLRVPGESASVMTCIDGFEMAKRGRAGAALGISAFGSFIAGTLGLLGLIFLAPPLAEFALDFGPPEYFALTLVGLTLVSFLGSGPWPRALAMAALGLLLGTVGLDPVRSQARFTFGTLSLQGGIEIIPMVMGLFGLSQAFTMIERRASVEEIAAMPKRLRELLPNRDEWRLAIGAILRGSLVGFLVGVLPGAGATISSYVAYAVEKRRSPHPERFGTGAIEGVAAPESANNAATASGFIPLLTLGLPANVVMALMLGAFMLHGVTPGPMLLVQKPDMFWGIVTSMFIGNLMLLVLNLPLIGVFARVAYMPSSYLVPVIVLACVIGAYGVNNNPVDILVMLGFGIFGYLAEKSGYSLAPLVLAFVLGPLMETSLRQSLILSQGSFGIFFERPITAALFALGAAVVIVPVLRLVLRWRAFGRFLKKVKM
ncbi:MAG: tripartite tricarboxylate transporter permease [Betaproteobacteria bacterium]|nr:tripartite tricarboxylate transporter permease [Betaproteobacteria bacterium]